MIIFSGKLIDGEQPVGQVVDAGSEIFKLDQGTMAMKQQHKSEIITKASLNHIVVLLGTFSSFQSSHS